MRKTKHGILTGTAALALAAVVLTTTHAATPATDARTIVHVLNRVTWGPRPSDVARVQQMGVERYIDEQLHPERLADTDLATRLDGFLTLGLSSRALAEQYEIPAVLARLAAKKSGGTPPTAQDRQRANLPLLELAQQKIVRATYSDRQLEDVLTDFWFNHFNVDARKGPTRFMLTEYERDAIRPHVLGRFRDLLGATATSPAMLFYLDNWMSAGASETDQAQPGRPRRGPRRQRAAGLNENYGRELLELHTLGVEGGYTQHDVTEVARAFTGWTIDRPRMGGEFRFEPALHDDGEKVVLGHRLEAHGGVHDGEQVLDIVARHPATARFISTKLARRFVGDSPPAALVGRMAETFQRSDGDLRKVMQVLLTSREFLSADADSTKVKTPFEFMISALRSTGAAITDARPLVRTVQELGMPLYQCQPPTGYTDAADAWVNTGALVNRMNVAMQLASGQLRGVSIPEVADASSLVSTQLSDATRRTLARAQTPAQAIALALGSPEFQRR